MLFIQNKPLYEVIEQKAITAADFRKAGLSQFQSSLAVQGFLEVTDANVGIFQQVTGVPEKVLFDMERRTKRKPH